MDRASAGRIDIQIVSHGHGDYVQTLLDDIGRPGYRVFVLENLADAELAVANRADVEIFRNVSPVGFAENHNRLAALGKAEFIAVLNPDLRLPADAFTKLLPHFDDPAVGIVAPRVHSTAGQVEDNARRVVTPASLLRRHLLPGGGELDYPDATRPCEPDWVAGMFMIFRRCVFEDIHGFDPGFRLYCEDVDVCLRTWLAGYKVVCAPSSGVVHAARRASRYNDAHFRWHLASLLRLWRSPTYWRFLRQGGFRS
jgi:GT2 family glycosyltransferase